MLKNYDQVRYTHKIMSFGHMIVGLEMLLVHDCECHGVTMLVTGC